MKDLRDRALRGLTWSFASQIGRHVIKFVVMVVLARLLSPREFGLMAMAWVAVGLGGAVAEMGLGSAVIQRKELNEEGLSSVLWFNIACGAAMSALALFWGSWVAWVYQEPVLASMNAVLCLVFLLNSFGVVPGALLTRGLDFKTLAVVEVSAAAVAGPAAILLAWFGWGVWSLVAQTLLNASVTAGALWVLGGWRPRKTFRWASVRELLPFSVNMAAETTFNLLTRNLDNLLIGIVLGSAAVGLYSRAYLVMLVPLIVVSRIPARVLFPAFSRLQDDKERVKSICLKVSRAVALITFPMMAGVFVTAKEFVLVVFGEQWAGMVPVLRILAGVGLMQSVTAILGPLYMSQGRADLQFKVGFFLKAVILLGIIAGLRWGIVGVAAGYAIAWTLTAYPFFHFAGRLIGLTWAEFIGNLTRILACSAAMGMVVGAFRSGLADVLSPAALLAVEAAAGAACYGGLIRACGERAWRDVRDLVAGRFRPIPA
ncbi:MAG: MOP flippase family protein [Elusimicrobiota bacterium]|jgi:PST family polysaccharide transporter